MTINWIKCSERLPEIKKYANYSQSEKVAVFMECRNEWIACYLISDGMWQASEDHNQFYEVDDSSHWAEIEGPKNDQD